MSNAVQRLIDEAVAAERERCAKLVEGFEIAKAKRRHPRINDLFRRLAAAIRKGPS